MPSSSHQIFYGDDILARLRRQSGHLAPLLAALLTTAAIWRHRYRTRRVLATLDDDRLRDIGRTRNDALGEARKPFWRA